MTGAEKNNNFQFSTLKETKKKQRKNQCPMFHVKRKHKKTTKKNNFQFGKLILNPLFLTCAPYSST